MYIMATNQYNTNKSIIITIPNIENISIKGYGLDPYFRSAAALSDAPPPLPVHLAACEGLAGES